MGTMTHEADGAASYEDSGGPSEEFEHASDAPAQHVEVEEGDERARRENIRQQFKPVEHKKPGEIPGAKAPRARAAEDDDEDDDEDEGDDDNAPNVAAGAPEQPAKLSRKQLQKQIEEREAELAKERQRSNQFTQREQQLTAQLNDLHNRYQQSIPVRQNSERQLLEARLQGTQSQIERIERDLRDAYENGDSAKHVELLRYHSDAMFQLNALRHVQQQTQAQQAQAQRQGQPQGQPQNQQRPAPQQQAAQQPSAKAVAWADKNRWFGSDEVMTGTAYVIDAGLQNEGYIPDSPAYYRELDKRLVEKFPEKFGGGKTRRAPVAGVRNQTRRQDDGRQSKLTAREKDMARRLGVSETAYAAHRK